MTRRWITLAAILLVTVMAVWFISVEAGASLGGLSRHDAVTRAASYVDSATPVTEVGSTPGPYLILGWGPTEARPWYRMVWAIGLSGTFTGHCTSTEANACFPEKIATVVIDYRSGQLVRLRYGS